MAFTKSHNRMAATLLLGIYCAVIVTLVGE